MQWSEHFVRIVRTVQQRKWIRNRTLSWLYFTFERCTENSVMNWLRSYLSSSSYTAIREAVIGDVVAFSMWGEGSSYEKYRKNQKMLPTTHDVIYPARKCIFVCTYEWTVCVQEPASTPLIVAINQRSLAPVKALIKEGADTNASDSVNFSLLVGTTVKFLTNHFSSDRKDTPTSRDFSRKYRNGFVAAG